MAGSLTLVSDWLDILGSEPGSILYRDTDGWRVLPPGNPGQVLEVNSENLPEWVDP